MIYSCTLMNNNVLFGTMAVLPKEAKRDVKARY